MVKFLKRGDFAPLFFVFHYQNAAGLCIVFCGGVRLLLVEKNSVCAGAAGD